MLCHLIEEQCRPRATPEQVPGNQENIIINSLSARKREMIAMLS